jgi:RHS repeat-associated protein
VQKDPGTTTLYLGDQQFTLNATTGAVTGTRYYTLPDGSQVIRTGSTSTSFTYAIADQHGTPSLYLDSTATTPTWRQYTPYGAARGDAVAAPDNRGFLNKPMDTTTGLTVVGARQYDPETGRFITDDPILEPTDPTQLNGYSYAGNNPTGREDPTGLMAKGDGGGCGGAYFYVNQFGQCMSAGSNKPYKDPTHISSVLDGISNAAAEAVKGIAKLDVDQAKCVAIQNCGGLKQDSKQIVHQIFTL